MCRIGGRLRSRGASLGGAALEIPPLLPLASNRDESPGHCMVGSLTGAVASQSVTEAREGRLRLSGNQPSSVMA